jgi:uncharacterized OB-fold protein
MIVPKYTREIPQRYRLEAGRCTSCSFIAFPPRTVCPECGEKKFTPFNLKPEGKVLTFTVIHIAADAFAENVPFVVGIIETKDGARLTSQIVDCKPEEVEIGTEVRFMLRRIQKEGHAGILQYGYKAVMIR